MNRSSFLTALAAPLLALPALSAEGSFSRTLTVSDGTAVEVHTGNGAVEVTHGPAGKVSIEAKIVAQGGWFSGKNPQEKVRRIVDNPPIEESGKRIVIGKIQEEELKKRVRIDYSLKIPEGTSLEARSGNGSIKIEKLSGPVDASTGNGSIQISQARGAVEARTGNGKISAQGSILGDWTLRTGNGKVSVDLPEDSHFEIDAKTGNGSIESDLPIAVRGKIRRNRLRGVAGKGGPKLSVRTGNGGISIR